MKTQQTKLIYLHAYILSDNYHLTEKAVEHYIITSNVILRYLQ